MVHFSVTNSFLLDSLCLLWLNEFVMMKHLAIHWEGSLKLVTRRLALLESVGTELFLRDTHSAIEVPDTRIYSAYVVVDWSMTLVELSRSGAADSCTRLKANNFPSTGPHYLLSLSIFHKHNWGCHPCPWHSTAVSLLGNLVSTHRTFRSIIIIIIIILW